jgi:hypothetical protein
MSEEKKVLTEKQEALLEALFGEANGNVRHAMRIAGYSDTAKTNEVLKGVRDEVIERATTMLALHAPKATFSMLGVLDDPGAMGARNAVAAAREILDRAGLVKREQVEVKSTGQAIFVLPPKKVADYSDEDDTTAAE